MRSFAVAALAVTAVAASDPLCAKGLKASDGSITVCCPKACGGCGGAGCGTFPGGASKCCVGKIIAAQTSCSGGAAPCVVDKSAAADMARTLTSEELQKLVLQMNTLDQQGVVSQGNAAYLTSVTDVIVYSAGAPSWDLKKTASQIYTTPVHLPEMEALELAAIAPPAESPPLPVALAPVGALQSCHGGTITDLDAYYKCTSIEGGLFVINLDVEDLSKLTAITQINGPLVIKGNKELKDIKGLGGVQGHVESIGIYSNPQLKFVEGLNGVSSTGTVLIADNKELVKLDALAHVCGELQYGIGIRNNPALQNLDGLSCLSKLGASGEGIAVEIDGNDALENIEALNHVQELEGAALITNNARLKSISGLRKVSKVGANKQGSSIVLKANKQLRACDGFQGTKALTGSIEAYGNPELRSLECLAGVKTIGANAQGRGVLLAKNEKLTDAGLDDVTDVAGSVIISETAVAHLSAAVLANVGKDAKGHSLRLSKNSQLASTSLQALQKVSGSVQVDNNDQLRSSGLFNLFWVGADAQGVSVEMHKNAAMSSTGLANLRTTQGGVAITGNKALTNTELLSLTSVGGAKSNGNCLEVVGNKVLGSIGAGKLTKCAGGVSVLSNPALSNLGLKQATFIGSNTNGQSIVVSGNGALQTLKGFPGATKLSGSVVVNANPSLQNLEGANGLTTVGKDAGGDSLEIANNAMLESVAALKNAKVYAGALSIQQNPKLKALDLGVESIVGKNLLGDSLLVEGNDALKDLAGLDNLHGSLPGAISITNNGALVSVKGLTKVTGAGGNVYGNSIEIVANKRLQDLTGLKLGGVIKGAVVVSGNGALKSLRGLCGVTSVAGVNAAKTSIDLSNNPKLVDAACLSNMGGLVKGNINLSGTSLASVAPLVKGKNPVTKVLGDIKVDMLHCLPNNEAKFLTSVCSTNACRTNIARARKCSWTGSSSNVYVGSGAQKPCGGASDAGWNTWSSAGSSGLYMDVDSSACNFALTPGYVTSVQGDAGHWQLVGVNSVYSATKNGFRVYVWHPQLRGSYLQYFAKRYNWRINWVADASQKAGVTKPGKSGWKQFAKDTVYVDVDTSACKYTDTPSIVTALHGASDHWRTQGVHSIYRATKTGFRVYVSHANVKLTAAMAEEKKWAVAWIGSNDAKRSGFSNSNWKLYCGDAGSCQDTQNYFALSMDVVTDAATKLNIAKSQDVTYVTSVSGTGPHLLATGGASLYRPTSAGFRVYLSHAPTAAFAKSNNWKVNWIAYAKPRDCQLAGWGTWGLCSKACGGGKLTRTRKVTVTASVGGYCPVHKETKACNEWACNLDCKMSAWSAYGACSATCGTGSARKTRTVVKTGVQGGKSCPPTIAVKLCTNGPCPVHCQVSAWTNYSPCTKTCGGGWKVRSRQVLHHAESGGFKCPNLTQKSDCGLPLCPVDCKLGEWKNFGSCTKTCGGGFRLRKRPVLTWPANGGVACEQFQEAEQCNEWSCDRTCKMTPWSDWTPCSASCGVGKQSRKRSVTLRRVDGKENCPATKATRTCFEGVCPSHCTVSQWGAFSKCTKTCGGGIRGRVRAVVTKAANGGSVCPILSETLDCKSQACPTDCQVSPWSAFTVCTKSCGKGTQSRDRAIIARQALGGKPCGAVREDKPCNAQACPINCGVSKWGSYTRCSAKCGFGSNMRTRKVVRKAANGGAGCPVTNDKKKCMIKKCAHPCPVSKWTAWSPCPTKCGVAGKQFRTRTTTVNNKKDCPQMRETKKCAAKKCNVACKMSAYGPWSACSKTCGRGTKYQLRKILAPAQGSGKACGAVKNTASCASPCPVDCLVGAFGDFGACSATCGTGTKTAARKVVRAAAYNGKACPVLTLTAACTVGPCPIDCKVGTWRGWAKCTKSCGGGFQIRSRKIITDSKFNGAQCPSLKEQRQCNWHPCPIDCITSDWTPFTACTASCGKGTKSRSRHVTRVAQFKGKACALLTNSAPCDAGPCPVHCKVTNWSGFSGCSATCGGGRMTRTRKVQAQQAWGGRVCPTLKNVQECNVNSCPIHCVAGYWSKWSTCTKTCGSGTQRKTRRIVRWAAYGGNQCGSLENTRICNTRVCAVDCEQQNWGAWSSCTGKCAEAGTQARVRVTYQFAIADGKACGVTQEDRSCQMDRCPKFCDVTQWGSFSACSKSCEYGSKTRTRKVVEHDDFQACPKLVDEVQCNTQKCPIDCKFTLWGSWAPYFGGGTSLQRVRQVTTPMRFNGKACPTQLVQYKQSSWCQEKDHMGEWGACAAGYQYRHREHVQCSTKASMRYHMTFRQGRHCGGAVAQAMRLSEQIDLSQSKDMKWTSMSMDEVLAEGMEAYATQKARM